MNKYKIIYIDESKDDSDDFLDYIEAQTNSDKFEVNVMFPKATIDEMLESIFNEPIDAVVMDYKLNDLKTHITYNIPYDGVQLAEKILSKKINFPCFVITSYDSDAIRASQDVNLVYIKDILHGSEKKTEAKATLLDKIENQILHYRKKISQSIKEMENLLKKEFLNGDEENRLLELDTFIEKATDAPTALPKNFKENSNLQALHKMIENTDSILTELRGELNGKNSKA